MAKITSFFKGTVLCILKSFPKIQKSLKPGTRPACSSSVNPRDLAPFFPATDSFNVASMLCSSATYSIKYAARVAASHFFSAHELSILNHEVHYSSKCSTRRSRWRISKICTCVWNEAYTKHTLRILFCIYCAACRRLKEWISIPNYTAWKNHE